MASCASPAPERTGRSRWPEVIDLHTHILPGVDDGAPDLDTSLAMARSAAADGIRTVVATPHVSPRYETTSAEVVRRVSDLNKAIREAGVPLTVLGGAEVSPVRIPEAAREELRPLCLGGSSCLLVESPYAHTVTFLDELLFDLQVAGFRPLLAHPERSPLFHGDVDRLRGLVARGVLCSVTASSLAGAFGSTVKRFSLQLVEEGLVHDVASDAHDDEGRPLALSAALGEAERDLPGLAGQVDWLTGAAPAAMLADEPLPPRPPLPSRRRSGWRRLLRARAGSAHDAPGVG